MFALKKWLWTQWQKLRGVDRAYARYLAHFEQVRSAADDQALRESLQLQPMQRDEFIKVWQQKGLTSGGKSCGCQGR